MYKEQWKTIVGFEGRYEVSSQGRIASLPRDYKYGKVTHRTILKPDINKGYARVTLFKQGKRHKKLVHILVAEAFIPKVQDKPIINHKDENKLNNQVDNLEWCTYKENSNYGTARSRISDEVSKRVVQLDKAGNVIKVWKSMTQASLATGACLSEISQCTRNSDHTAKGYRWRLEDE